MNTEKHDRRLTYYIKAAEWAQHAVTEPRLGELNVSYGQLAALMAIAETPRITAAELARRSGITPQSTGETVAALLRKGLVQRQAGDLTRKRLELTTLPQGERVLERAHAVLAAIEQELTAGLAPDAVATAKTLLRQVIARAGAMTRLGA